MCHLKNKEEVEDQKQTQIPEELISISLINWKLLTYRDFIRYQYQVIEITTHPDPFHYRDNWEVLTSIVGYAYRKGVYRSTVRCQHMYYFGIEGFGSIVCEKCMCGARFALFSLYETAYVNKIHAHSLFAAKCQYCNQLIGSTPISKCEENKNEVGIFLISPLYRCLRVYSKFVVNSDKTISHIE